MPHIPYADGGPAELVAAMKARRGGELLNLDRMLLNSPAFAGAWNGFIGSVRTGLGISLKLQELAICTIAVLNGAEYELHHHGPVFLSAGGTPEQLEALMKPMEAGPFFDESERAVLGLAVEMTRDIELSPATLGAVAVALLNQEAIELIGVIAAYNMVSRFLIATGIEIET